MPEIKLADCDIITAFDPARTREAEYGRLARSALMTTACDKDYNVYIIDYFAARCNLDVIYNEVCKHSELYKPRCIGVEDVATQIAIGDAFQLLSQRDGIRLPPLESLRPDTRIQKKWRIKTIIQRYGPYGKLYVRADAYEFRSEFGAFPTGRTIDLLDVYAYCLTMHNIPEHEFARNYNQNILDARKKSKGSVINIEDERDKRYMFPSQPLPGFKVMKIG